MIFRYTSDNIMSLMQTVGTLQKDQIIGFFKHELPEYRIKYLLNQLTIKHILVYNEETDYYSFVGAAHFREETQKKQIRAFWVLVAAGSSNVLQILIPEYPTQFLFIGTNEEVYDVTIVESHHDALLAQRIRSNSLFRGVSDPVTHTAILRRAEDVKMLEGCGFDNYCTIDPTTKEVTYYRIDDN